MDWIKCSSCGEYHWSTSDCKPLFMVRCPEFDAEDEFVSVRAHDAESAAEEYCDYRDRDGDYTIVGQGGVDEVIVTDESGNVTRWNVGAETVAHYSAREA